MLECRLSPASRVARLTTAVEGEGLDGVWSVAGLGMFTATGGAEAMATGRVGVGTHKTMWFLGKSVTHPATSRETTLSATLT